MFPLFLSLEYTKCHIVEFGTVDDECTNVSKESNVHKMCENDLNQSVVV